MSHRELPAGWGSGSESNMVRQAVRSLEPRLSGLFAVYPESLGAWPEVGCCWLRLFAWCRFLNNVMMGSIVHREMQVYQHST